MSDRRERLDAVVRVGSGIDELVGGVEFGAR